MKYRQLIGIKGVDPTTSPRHLEDGYYVSLKNWYPSDEPNSIIKSKGQRQDSTIVLSDGTVVNSVLAGTRVTFRDGSRYTVLHVTVTYSGVIYGTYIYWDVDSSTWKYIDPKVDPSIVPAPPNEGFRGYISYTNPARFAYFNDFLVIVDGQNRPMKWSGVSGYIAYIGLPKPNAPSFTVLDTTQSQLQDQIRYAITFVNHQGESTLGYPTDYITTFNNQVQLTSIPITPTTYDTLSRRIYRERLSNPGKFLLIDEIADNSTTSWTDVWGTDKEGDEAPTNEEPPASAKYVVATEDTLALGGDPLNPNRSFYCQAGEIESWSSQNIGDITEPITGYAYWRGNIYIYSKNTANAWKVGSNPVKIEGADGCIFDLSIVVGGDKMWWLSPNGFVEFNSSTTNPISKPMLNNPLSEAIPNNPQFVHCAYKDYVIWLSIIPESHNFNDCQIYYYHTKQNRWIGKRTNHPVAFWVHYNGALDNNELYYASWHNTKFIQADFGTADLSSSYLPIPIATEIITPVYQENDLLAWKTYNGFIPFFNAKGLAVSAYARNFNPYDAVLNQDSPTTFTIGENSEDIETFGTVTDGQVLTSTNFTDGYIRDNYIPISVLVGTNSNCQFVIDTSEYTEYAEFFGHGYYYLPRSRRRVFTSA